MAERELPELVELFDTVDNLASQAYEAGDPFILDLKDGWYKATVRIDSLEPPKIVDIPLFGRQSMKFTGKVAIEGLVWKCHRFGDPSPYLIASDEKDIGFVRYGLQQLSYMPDHLNNMMRHLDVPYEFKPGIGKVFLRHVDDPGGENRTNLRLVN